MKTLSRRFLTGLAALLPAVLTVYFLYWLATSAERLLGGLLRMVLPAGTYWPGMGLVVALLLVLLVGFLMEALVVQALFGFGERLLYRLPLVKTVYGSLRDFFRFFSSGKKEFSQVVAVRLAGTDMKMIGFVTRSDLTDFPAAVGGPERIAVYVPLSYQIGGHTLLLPREAVEHLDMSMEQAMRFALTAGIVAGDGPQRPARRDP